MFAKIFSKINLKQNKSGLHPEELSAIFLALLVLIYLVFPGITSLLPEKLKVLLAFIAIFLVPGFLISGWFPTMRRLKLRRLVYSFVFGFSVWTAPASILMNIKASWEAFYVVFFLVNLLLIGITVYLLRFRPQPATVNEQSEPADTDWKKPSTLILFVLLLVSLVPVIRIADTDFMSGDLMSFVVTIRNIIHDSHFSLTEPIFGTGYSAPLRMVINPWGLLPAFMAKISDVDPMYFFSRNIPGIMVVLAIFSIYLLVMEFNGNRDLALFTTLFTVILFLADPYPRLFSPALDMLRRISADKFFLLYISMPAGLGLARRFFVYGHKHAFGLAIFVGLGIGLTHPLIALFLVVSTATFVSASYLFLRRYRKLVFFKRAVFLAVMCGIVMVVPILQQAQYEEEASQLYSNDFALMPLEETNSLIMPYVALHSMGIPGSQFPEVKPAEPGEPNPLVVGRLYSQIAGEKLLLLNEKNYITHPDLLINWPSLLALALTPLLLIWVRKDDQAMLMFSTTLVYLFLSFNPIVTPLIGRFITPWMVYRLTWPILVHYTLAYILYQAVHHLLSHPVDQLASMLGKSWPRILRQVSALMPVFILVGMALVFRTFIGEFYYRMIELENPVSSGISEEMTAYLQENLNGKEYTILSDTASNPLVSSLLYRTYVVAHRYNTTNETFPDDKQDEAIQRLIDVEYFTDATKVDEHLMEIIDTYGVDYILLPIKSQLTCQIPYLDDTFRLLFEDADYQLYQVLSGSADEQVVTANSDLLAGNSESAETIYRNSIQQDGGTVLTYLGLSSALQQEGRYPEALKVAKEALASSPESICVNRELGDLYIAIGDYSHAAERYQTLATLKSENDQDYKTLGDLYWLTDQPDKADAAYKQSSSIRFGEDTKEYFQFLYGLFMRLGDDVRANQYIQAAIDLGPSPDTYLIASQAAAVSGSTEEAAIFIDQALNADPDQNYMIAAYAALGDLYLSGGQYEQAIAAYQQGIREGFYDMDWGTDFYLRIANVYQEMGETAKALEQYQKIAQYDPSTSGPYLAAGQIYQEAGDLQAALNEYKKAALAKPFDTMSYLQAAAVYQQVGLDEQMNGMYEQALGIDPFQGKIWLLYANRLLGQEDYSGAELAFEKALDLNDGNSAVYVGMGNLAGAEDRWNEALANYFLAILHTPTSSQGYVALGDAFGQLDALDKAATAYNQAITLDPDNPAAYAKLSNAYRQLGEMDKALEVDQAALDAAPDSIEALLSLANAYYTEKDYVQAADLYRRILALDPNQVRPYLSLAEIALVQENDQQTALEMYQAAVTTNPSYGLAITALGDFYLQQGQLYLAEQAYRQALELPEVTASNYLAVSNLQQMRGDWDQALLTLQTAVKEVTDPGNAYSNLAGYYLGRGDLEMAIKAYRQAIKVDPENAKHYAALASLAITHGDLEQAAQILEQGAQSAEDQSVIHTARAAYLEEIGKLTEAENALLDAAIPPVNSPEPYQNLAQFYRDNGRLEDAINVYQHALLEFPGSMEVMVQMGQTYYAMDCLDDAIKWLGEATSADKNDPSPWLALSSLYLSEGQLEQAEQAAQQALDIRPTNDATYLQLAGVYDALERPDLARWAYEQACQLDQSQSECLMGLSQLDWQARDYEKAIAGLQTAIALQPAKLELYQALAEDYRLLGDTDLAEQTLSQAIEKTQDLETAYQARADFYATLGKWDQAEADYRTSLQAYPFSQNAGLQLANFYAARDDVPRTLNVLQNLIRLPTVGPDAYNALGDLYASKAGWGDAMDAYRKALAVDPQYNQALIGLSKVLGQLGRGEEALSTLEEAAATAPEDVNLLMTLGNAYMGAVDYSSARQIFTRVLEIDPKNPAALVGMDNLQAVSGEASKGSLDDLLQIAEDAPSADIFEMIASQYQAHGDWDTALSWRQRAVKFEPFNGTAWLNLGNHYLTWQDFENAEIALNRAAQYLPASPSVLLAMGSLRQAQGLDAEAEAYYNQAIEAAPGQIGAYVALSNLKSDLGDTQAALDILNQGLTHTPAAVLAYQTLGLYYQSQQDHDAAIQSYQEGLEVVPGAAELKVDQGNLYVKEYQEAMRELASAESTYQSALDWYERTLLMPNRDWAIERKENALSDFKDAQNYLSRSQADYERVQPFADIAKTAFEEALAIQPNSTNALVGMGKVAEIREQWNEAIGYYQQGLSIDPNSVDTWIALGDVYMLKGDIDKAQNAYQNALNISPYNVQASAGIVSATQTLSPWSIEQALDNAAYSQYNWESIIQYLRESEN
jgi:superkiller protein 3